jgi:surface polysaccharide O-acyltransferase-like enzyme
MNTGKRVLWADIARIIAIYLVMVVHSTVLPERLTNTTPLFILFVFAAAKTCVPLFVMLSGTFLLTKEESYPVFIKKRLLRLLIPWIFWTIVFTVWNVVTQQIQISSFREFLHAMQTVFIGFWFLPMLFGLYLFTPALRILFLSRKDREVLIVIILWFFCLSFLPFVHNTNAFPMISDNGLVRQVLQYSGYFLIGGLFASSRITFAGLTGFFIFCFGITWTVFGVVHMTLANKGGFVGNYFDYVAPGVAIATTGAYCFLQRFGLIIETKLSVKQWERIVSISKLTLGIYLVHHFFVPVAHRLFFGETIATVSVIYTIAMATALFFVSTAVMQLLNRIPGVKRIIY